MTDQRYMDTRGRVRRDCRSTWLRVVGFAVLLLLPSRVLAVDSSFIRSLVIPGLGQAHQGHYTRAALFAGVAVTSGFGLLLSHVYYNEAVDKYNEQKRIYAGYQETLENGGVVSFEDIRSTYAQMQAEHDSADGRLAWRNGFLVAFVATYALNVVDVLLSKPDDGERGEPVSIEVTPGSLRIGKTFNF